MGRLDGKVAFITGGARGQGRTHALRCAEEGADIVVIDMISKPDAFPWLPYPLPTEDDLNETAKLVEATGRDVIAHDGDVRDVASLEAAVQAGVGRFGHIDIVSANAGLGYIGTETWKTDDQHWNDILSVNLLGVRNTIRATLPTMIEAARGGSVIITSSTAALKASYGLSDYISAKMGVIGLSRALAAEAGPHHIRVNVIAPGTCDTDMIQNESLYRIFRPDLENPGREDIMAMLIAGNLLPIPWIEPVDISNALVFLASDEARYITGQLLSVDGGWSAK